MPVNLISILKNAITYRHGASLLFSQRRHMAVKQAVPCAQKPTIMTPDCKVAIVTGGSEGIGFQIANYLLKNGARAVAITGLDSCNGKSAVTCLNNAYGRNKAMFINSNSNCMVQLEETFKVVKEAYQNIDMIVNCAAMCNGIKWEAEIVTNIIGTVRVLLLAYKYVGIEGMGKGGIVVNMAGVGGLEPMPPIPTMSCCYHGIVGLSRSFGDRSHLDRSGIRVVCLCPGITNTNFFKNSKNQGMTDQMSVDLAKYLKNSKKQLPDVCGMAVIHLIRFAESGSVWVCDGSRLFQCNIPKWDSHSTLESQFL